MIVTIHGRPASKKNSKRIFHRYGKTFVLPSKQYDTFRESAMWSLKSYKEKFLEGYLSINITFYLYKGFRQDIDSAESSLFDVLQDAGIIKNDDQFDLVVKKKIRQATEWKTEFEILRLPE